ncbi:MAG: hypothetical protein GDA48_24435 [Hormoscilla sp. GM102CHS1]|nr:hypothetical protein [Hormoscilla sp. GM102CHS1]
MFLVGFNLSDPQSRERRSYNLSRCGGNSEQFREKKTETRRKSEKKANRTQFLVYADGDKIRCLVNAANHFDFAISIKDMDMEM